MNITLWTVGVLLLLIAVVTATLPLKRRGPSRPTLRVGSISDNWLTEYNAKHGRNRP